MIEIIPNWHPIFVHFTVALLIIATITHLLSHFLPKGDLANQLTIVARWNFWFGIGFTLLTVSAGWYAFNTVTHDAPSHLAMIEHRNWAVATFALLLCIASWKYYLSRQGKGVGWLFTGLLVIATGLLMSTAWHGGELVYRYGLGVMSIPKAEDPGHAHSHDATSKGDPPQNAEPGSKTPAANGTSTTPEKPGHTHASGTPPHKD